MSRPHLAGGRAPAEGQYEHLKSNCSIPANTHCLILHRRPCRKYSIKYTTAVALAEEDQPSLRCRWCCPCQAAMVLQQWATPVRSRTPALARARLSWACGRPCSGERHTSRGPSRAWPPQPDTLVVDVVVACCPLRKDMGESEASSDGQLQESIKPLYTCRVCDGRGKVSSSLLGASTPCIACKHGKVSVRQHRCRVGLACMCIDCDLSTD